MADAWVTDARVVNSMADFIKHWTRTIYHTTLHSVYARFASVQPQLNVHSRHMVQMRQIIECIFEYAAQSGSGARHNHVRAFLFEFHSLFREVSAHVECMKMTSDICTRNKYRIAAGNFLDRSVKSETEDLVWLDLSLTVQDVKCAPSMSSSGTVCLRAHGITSAT